MSSKRCPSDYYWDTATTGCCTYIYFVFFSNFLNINHWFKSSATKRIHKELCKHWPMQSVAWFELFNFEWHLFVSIVRSSISMRLHSRTVLRYEFRMP